ncbi:hypothetical protein HMPREF0872_00195 [Veillonella montpellierensis DNF00314]|uniref:Uncharacterized protein n=1 Tax=Veillonella montpellierensis DNF00314 TaxID=1401067 RepID=A0A096ALV0_9FIRM|nr:hypothetical protein [Veillonella montpellierensis]KGF48068.1 hypothetical protein HMPREF0872_00195 [Veillonella montpellierensis DNF00314]
MNEYVFVLDEKGVRITSLLLGVHADTIEELERLAHDEYKNCTVIVGDSTMQAEFLNNKAYKNGVFIEIEEEKPSLLEQKKQKIAQIKAKYNDKFTAYENALLRARLDDNDSQVKKLQELYRADKEKMIAEIKGA